MNKLFSIFSAERPGNLFWRVFTGVLFLDQLGKWTALGRGEFQANPDALLGLRADPVLAAAALLGLFFFWRDRREEKSGGFRFALALIGAGISSNLLDRVRYGFIVDYLILPGLCACNLADFALLAGALFFVWRIFRE